MNVMLLKDNLCSKFYIITGSIELFLGIYEIWILSIPDSEFESTDIEIDFRYFVILKCILNLISSVLDITIGIAINIFSNEPYYQGYNKAYIFIKYDITKYCQFIVSTTGVGLFLVLKDSNLLGPFYDVLCAEMIFLYFIFTQVIIICVIYFNI